MRPKSVHKLPVCKHCNKPRGMHLARFFNCPIGSSHNSIGVTSYHRSQKFEPVDCESVRKISKKDKKNVK